MAQQGRDVGLAAPEGFEGFHGGPAAARFQNLGTVAPTGGDVQRVVPVGSCGLFKGGVGQYPGFTHMDTRGSNADW